MKMTAPKDAHGFSVNGVSYSVVKGHVSRDGKVPADLDHATAAALVEHGCFPVNPEECPPELVATAMQHHASVKASEKEIADQRTAFALGNPHIAPENVEGAFQVMRRIALTR